MTYRKSEYSVVLKGCKRRKNDLDRKRIGEILQTLINPNAFPEA